MKCVVMAGGKGTRGMPYTEFFPKAMIPIHDIPMIERITDHLVSYGITEIVVVCDVAGMGAQIQNHYRGDTIISCIQDTGSGTAGDLRHAGLAGESEFMVWFCDNLCALNVDEMLQAYRRGGAAACIATRGRRPEETGFAQVCDGMVLRFMEKPIVRMPSPQCLGIYILDGSIYDMICDTSGPLNLSYDILNEMPNRGGISTYDIRDEPWLDVESPNILSRNHTLVEGIISRMGQPASQRPLSAAHGEASGLSHQDPLGA